MQSRYIIGITGGIGTGKSKVLQIFAEEFDAFVIEADKVGHDIMAKGEKGYEMVVEAFGHDILDVDRNIDRGILGKIVFGDTEKLKKLNSITHPLIHGKIEKMITESQKRLIVVEAAILVTTSLAGLCDSMWYIYADENVRLSRLAAYRGISEKKALSVIKNQPSDSEFRAKCQVVIDNSNGIEETFMQIKKRLLEENYG